MPIDLKAYAKDIEERIKQIHEDLEPLEAGKMTIGEPLARQPLAQQPDPIGAPKQPAGFVHHECRDTENAPLFSLGIWNELRRL